jgi:type III secretion protein C
VVDQDVAGVIAGIAAQLGVRVDVSSNVQGEVRGRLPDGSVRAMLDRLAAQYRFDWYFDGQTLFATDMAQAQTKVLPLGAVPPDDLLQTLAAFGIADQRWPVRISRSGDMAYVSGPPRLVGMTENVLSALAQRAASATADVRVFRGATAGS